jgi:hypothetical protein
MTWVFLRVDLPNSAAILALALVPIMSLAFDGTKRADMRSNVVQAAISETVLTE